jgi:hypothetical protein
MTIPEPTLASLVGELLDMLETVEESDLGSSFHPTTIRSCRCLHSKRLAEIMPQITTLVRKRESIVNDLKSAAPIAREELLKLCDPWQYQPTK